MFIYTFKTEKLVESKNSNIDEIKHQLRYIYTITPSDYSNCNISYLTTHNFSVATPGYQSKCFYVDSEVDGGVTEKFRKGQKVNVFGLPYIFSPYNKNDIYGGITPSTDDGILRTNTIAGNFLIDGVQQKTLINPIKIDKPIFTIQEFDFKIRQYLMQTYKIYDPNSPYIKGQLEIAINGNKHESFNLYDATSSSTRSDIFKKYKDNKTINMKDFSHFDIYLWTK
ncbi:exotoxin beta-grasp domain-containing protein [Streptococcus pyogenes]|uniref:exotoxin beta-grasp domain-containing protein n=1 Tax=Streptococcus pyogenes TaxID=1314 RepID=UPI0013DB154A|nr:exotoxin beta-grasp domain-containing protein [Streptococcus pyogenes]NDY79808.1 exotoxin [Streptococcus pyogenes]